jgi:GDP-mannose 6-dehydrogenase
VHFANLIGANRDYLLGVLPHVAELMVPDVSEAMDWAELIVLTTSDPTYMSALAEARADQIILDLAGVDSSDWQGPRLAGFLW